MRQEVNNLESSVVLKEVELAIHFLMTTLFAALSAGPKINFLWKFWMSRFKCQKADLGLGGNRVLFWELIWYLCRLHWEYLISIPLKYQAQHALVHIIGNQIRRSYFFSTFDKVYTIRISVFWALRFDFTNSWIWIIIFLKHYENTPIQIYWKILQPKNENFQIKNTDIFYTSAQNIDCG